MNFDSPLCYEWAYLEGSDVAHLVGTNDLPRGVAICDEAPTCFGGWALSALLPPMRCAECMKHRPRCVTCFGTFPLAELGYPERWYYTNGGQRFCSKRHRDKWNERQRAQGATA